MSLSIKSNGSFAFMGIAAAVASEADTLQSIYAALYAKRYASVQCGPRAARRSDCLDTSTVQVYATPRAYRRERMQAHLISTHFC